MCLLVLAWQVHPRYRLVLAANRDEYHARPAAALAKWPPPSEMLAGRDLQAGGTWLGLDRRRRFGVVTNFRELQPPQPGAPSRGELIPRYLGAAAGAAEYFGSLAGAAGSYSGFNLLLADEQALWYGSNRAAPFARALPSGVYGLSNELLDTPWEKLTRVRAGFEAWLRHGAEVAALFALLADRTPAPDAGGADTGALPQEWARALSAPFVLHPRYGTRCSSVLLLEAGGALSFSERRFDAAGACSGETRIELKCDEWP
jgi:uncharacterized protein with NRDE domain